MGLVKHGDVPLLFSRILGVAVAITCYIHICNHIYTELILSHGRVAWFHPLSCWFRWERMQQPWFNILGYGPGVDRTSFCCNYVMESIKVVPVSKSWFSLFEIYHFGFSQFQTSQILPKHNKLRNPNGFGVPSFLIFRPATVQPCLQPWVRWLRMWEFWSQAHVVRLDAPAMTKREKPKGGTTHIHYSLQPTRSFYHANHEISCSCT